MDRASWTRIEEIFHAAADRPPDEREAYLRDACGGDESLMNQVRALLDADARAGRTMQDAIGREAARLIAPAGGAAWVGRRIGPWLVTRAIGEGGGGIVLQGVRYDGRFEQTVAIKVLRLGVNRLEHLARFRRERRLVAQLEHPHIARLLDGGEVPVGDDGVEAPYLVMEH